MGRSTTPTYRVETSPIYLPDSRMSVATPAAWDTRQAGRPTEANLERWVHAQIDSTKPGGVNAHIGRSLGIIPVPSWARVIRQRTGEVVARWKAPAFMVI